MDCKKANDLMMKYMDESMNEEEAMALKEHIGKCSQCYEDFLSYNEILEEFSDNTEVINAPDDFEACVMEKIYSLGEVYKPKENSFYSFLYGIWGVISLLCGFGMVLMLNKATVISYLSSKEAFSGYVKYFTAIDGYVMEFKDSIIGIFNKLLNFVGGYILNIQIAAIIALLVLIIAQVAIFRKNKVEAR